MVMHYTNQIEFSIEHCLSITFSQKVKKVFSKKYFTNKVKVFQKF